MRTRADVDMYVSCLLRYSDLNVQAAFGKIPGEGGIWSLGIRYSNGNYRSSMLEGENPATLTLSTGQVLKLPYVEDPVRYVLGEADLYFNGKLPCFDGNVRTLLGTMRLLQRLKEV